jgi:type III pantothenate kinase
MILAIDIGNSDITIGIDDGKQWLHVWRIPVTTVESQEMIFGIRIRDYFLDAGIKSSSVRKIMISSVVPRITEKIASVSQAIFDVQPIMLDHKIYSSLPIKILNPYEIGSDLVANALAAYTRVKANCIVVDFGTALTFTTISKYGEILGVAISPGLGTAIRSLSRSAEKLYDVPLEPPPSVLGKSTVHAIQAGILIGYEGLITGMITRIKREINDDDCLVIATGGLASIIDSVHSQFTTVEPNLTLNGLRIAASFID